MAVKTHVCADAFSPSPQKNLQVLFMQLGIVAQQRMLSFSELERLCQIDSQIKSISHHGIV